MRIGTCALIASVIATVVLTAPLAGQGRIAGPRPGVAIAIHAGAQAQPAMAHHALAVRRASGTRLVLGGVIGAVAGVLACNLISEAIEEADASSGCTTKGNLMFGVGGAAIGLLVAVLTD